MIDADFKKMESRELLLDNPIAYLLSRENHVFCSEIGIPMALNGITPVYDFYLLKPDEYKLIHYNECDYIVIADRGNDTYFAARKNEDMVYFFNIEDDIDRIWEVNSNIEKFIRTLILVENLLLIERDYTIEDFKIDFSRLDPDIYYKPLIGYWSEYIANEDGSCYGSIDI